MADDKIPRQIRDIKGLVKFCIENTASEDNTGPTIFTPMDEERRKWLEEALVSMTESPHKVMAECIGKLVGPEDDGKKEALESLIEWIEDIDLAADFHKMGGFDIIPTLLNYRNATLRSLTCGLLAGLVQNHPYCQKVALEHKLMDRLIVMVEDDSEQDVRRKALYALSSLLRGYDEGQLEFIDKKDGFSVLMRAMQNESEKVKVKAVFLLSDICSTSSRHIDTLCNMGMIEQLIGLLRGPHDHIHEYIMMSLVTMTTTHEKCREECVRPELGLRQLLQDRIKDIKEVEEFQDEYKYCRQLNNILGFEKTKESPSVDR